MHDSKFETLKEAGDRISQFGKFVHSDIDLDGANAYKPTEIIPIPFKEILKEMAVLYARKNADYDNSFDKSLDEDGLLVAKIRLGDKLSRFSNLIKHDNQVKDESIRDTLIDLANYAVMTLVWLDKLGDN